METPQQKHSASLPRRRYWANEIAKPDCCPECGGPLEKEYHAYLLVIREKDGQAPFLTGNDAGRFCVKCPVVVLHPTEFAKIAGENSTQRNPPFAVAGIVDLAAVPEDKAELPFGDENPLPLVEFTNLDDGKPSSHVPVMRETPKIGRNDACPCGSGKKYKKCCGAA